MEKSAITGLVPVLGIDSYADAVACYVGWLGFSLDWEYSIDAGHRSVW